MTRPHARLPTWATVVLPLALLVFAVGGLWFYRAQDQAMRRKVEEELATIAGLKAEQIVAWRRDQLEDAGLIAENATLVVATARYWADPGDETGDQLLRVFRRVQKGHDYADILLVDANGHVCLSLAGAAGDGHPEMLSALETSLRERRPVLVDLHAGDLDPSPHISVVAPVFSDAAGGEPAGALVLMSEARAFLYPLVESWPRPSKTAETLLIRRDGDEVLFLNDLRHQAGTALTLRIPIDRTDVPAVMAALGRRGVVYGRDYREVSVVSHVSAIPDSPWLMVAKEDADEAFSEWRFRSVMILAFLAGLAAAVGAVILVVWQRNEKGHYRTLYETESALRALSARQQALLAAVPDIIMEVDVNKRYTWANRAGIEFFGEDVVGTEAASYFDGEQDTYETVAPLFKGQEGVIYAESWQRRRDGERRLLAWWGRVLKDAKENVIGALSSARDITERSRAEQQLLIQKRIADIFLTIPDDEMFYEVLQVVLEAMQSPFGVFGYIDEAGALVVPTMTRLIWDKCQVPEKTITFPRSTWGDSSWPRAIREKMPNYSNEVSTRTPAGHVTLTRHISLPILFRGDVIGLFQVANKAVDYTAADIAALQTVATYVAPVLSARLQRQRQEENLRSLNQELARANAELQRFAYVASHDLQEPLRMIASYLQLIEGRYKDRLDADGLEFMAFAVDGANRLQTMIRDLLEYSRVGSRGMPLEEVDAEEALDQALQNLQVQIADSGAVVTHDPLPRITADQTQIVQVFQNLISNAIKFRSSEPPRIHITSRRQDDECVFSARDNGLGVAPELNERIFIVFQRLHGQEYPGTGIGLAICKRIVERHKGRIWVESEAGTGATFHFSIPIATGGNV
ncbi:GAF domain-containing protein [Candidatus Fermentibacteria bacterium]|nr:GAF domain-containing protein [Candidatus Fermentibacteria bacterium]